MRLKDLIPALELFLSSSAAFLVHFLYLQFLSQSDRSSFHYSLPELYAYFFLLSVVILAVLIRIKKTNIDSVGNTFLLLTCMKMVVAYLLMRPILRSTAPEALPERISFFAVFAVFLTIETVISIRMLNRK